MTDPSSSDAGHDRLEPARPGQPVLTSAAMPSQDQLAAGKSSNDKDGDGQVQQASSSTKGPSFSVAQPSEGSFTSFDTARSEQPLDEGQVDSQSMMGTSKLSSAASSVRRQRPPSELGASSKKPLPRRASSQFQGPHRGQGFSVDDDPAEVEAEYFQRQHSVASTTSGRASLKRKPSAIRRRGTVQATTLARVDSMTEEDDEEDAVRNPNPGGEPDVASSDESGEEGTIRAYDAGQDAEDETDLSDAESFTLKDRQEAINETHPFGIRVWKPALYKKLRSVEKSAEGDIHSVPGGRVSSWLFLFNILWTTFFGWWLAVAAAAGGIVCLLFGFAPSSIEYGRVLLDLSTYLFYPFGKFVKLHQDAAYADEDEGEGRSISEYEQWRSGDIEDGRLIFGPLTSRPSIGRRRSSLDSASETDSLLGRVWGRGHSEEHGPRSKRRLFGRGEWNVGRVIYFIFFYGLVAPLLLIASGICWLLVFWIPMGKVTLLLFYHLRRHPLALSFHSDGARSRGQGARASSVLLCTYRAVGLKYWKYTIDGTNIFLINLLSIVFFVIFDYWILDVALNLKIGLTHPALIFTLSLASIIPLAYFIGQAVASISAQSSMGLGAAINAFFSTVVEVYLYCIALNEGKGRLVEGSIIGSIFAGILFLPGLSMCFGALKRKTQRFNARSAGVTSTMLLFAVIAAFGPTLFYQIYGTHQLYCQSCTDSDHRMTSRDCKQCYFSQVPAVNDRFFHDAVRPYCIFAAALMFLAYIIGLWFTLRTHAAVIWNTEAEEKKPLHFPPHTDSPDVRHDVSTRLNRTLSRQQSMLNPNTFGRTSVRDSELYKRILGQSLKQFGLGSQREDRPRPGTMSRNATGSTQAVPPRVASGDTGKSDGGTPIRIPGFSDQQNRNIVQEVAEVAATAATVATRDAFSAPRRTSINAMRTAAMKPGPTHEDNDDAATVEAAPAAGAHDAPNWSRTKSAIILLGATLLYAIIAEILVKTVDVVLVSADVDEKFLGITLFALVPNTTEFLNAISFAMNGNIALSMEIGSAYALQVCLLQIPALVLYSAIQGRFSDHADRLNHTFTLIFPQWDMVTVILCVFLLSYMYGEGKSNYFKGSILILSYLFVTMGFYLSGMTALAGSQDSRFETVPYGPSETFRTVGRGRSGRAW